MDWEHNLSPQEIYIANLLIIKTEPDELVSPRERVQEVVGAVHAGIDAAMNIHRKDGFPHDTDRQIKTHQRCTDIYASATVALLKYSEEGWVPGSVLGEYTRAFIDHQKEILKLQNE